MKQTLIICFLSLLLTACNLQDSATADVDQRSLPSLQAPASASILTFSCPADEHNGLEVEIGANENYRLCSACGTKFCDDHMDFPHDRLVANSSCRMITWGQTNNGEPPVQYEIN